MSRKELCCEGWSFLKTKFGTDYIEVQKERERFAPVTLPHDWLIFQVADLYETSTGWYAKTFEWNPENLENHCVFCFEGVYMDSVIYVNGSKAFEWKYGYSTFEADVTDYLKEGKNELMVQVKHQSPNSRWYSGAGIYRKVWMCEVPKRHLVSNGIYIHTRELNQSDRQSDFEVIVSIATENAKGCMLCCEFEGKTVEKVVEEDTEEIRFVAENPIRWDIKHPHCYLLKTKLRDETNSKLLDTAENKFGIRTIELNPDQGFLLNHAHVKLNGVCNHHDLGALGAAVNVHAIRRQLEIMQEMGVNAIRTTHNMPSVELLELADEMGILVVCEAFDMWERPKTQYDYARFFDEWYKTDVKSWITRDRNHPSVIMWSIGNEICDTHADERGQEVTRLLMEEVLKHDPLQNAYVTIGSNYMPWENAQKCADIVKIAGYNYAESYYKEHHEKHPDWVIYGSETSSTVQSRGIYHFPLKESVLADEDEQCSTLGNSTTSWGALNSESCIIAERDHAFSMGQFLWSGFDYIGEPTPYHTKNSYFGQVDTAGFPKDTYYIYQSAWVSVEKKPMIHIFPYWDFNPGQLVDVRVCTNASETELFLNGSSCGRKKIDHLHGEQLVADYQIAYEPGELLAIAYDEEGNEIIRESRHSFGEVKKLTAVCNKTELTADGTDLAFLEISAVDEDGYPVENANNRVQVQVEGAGFLAGLDNGDSTDYDEYKGSSRYLFSGKLLAIIQAKKEPGEIKVTISSKDTDGVQVHLTSKKEDAGTKAKGELQMEEVFEGHLQDTDMEEERTLIRKIELLCLSDRELSKEKNEVQVGVRIFPQNAQIDQLDFSIVTDGGILSDLAKITEIRSKEALTESEIQKGFVRILTLQGVGDGEFRLRATTKNGFSKVKVISVLEFACKGLGQLYFNPYQFVTAGLYNDAIGEVSNGNEHGVATAREGRTVVGFCGVDFGETGSDEITLPVFELGGERCEISLWDGNPDKGGILLEVFVYQKPSIWNVYQEETYRLAKRLKGIHNLYFELHQKIHVKGFSFKEYKKAFEQLNANQCNSIYGDQMQVTEEAVENIGNNVTLGFLDMDFGEQGCKSITVCGRTKNEVNTIQIRFFDGEKEQRQILEFKQCEEYSEQVFPLETVQGKQQVSFIFLPGSQFDFKWFCFQ